MSSPDWDDIGRQALACDGFEWLVGQPVRIGASLRGVLMALGAGHQHARMCIAVPRATSESTWAHLIYVDPANASLAPWEHAEALPDYEPPGAVGYLAALARKAWAAPRLYVSPTWMPTGRMDAWGKDETERAWHAGSWGAKVPLPNPHGPTETEAWLAALNAAPKSSDA